MASVKAYKHDDPDAPKYPAEFEISKKAVLQVTDIKTNHNKYYAIELHTATQKGTTFYRVFTHYGRTDDLETNPNAGQKESRYLKSLGEAEACYQSIFREKTSAKKGYKEVSLASSKIGSQKARGQSGGEGDNKTPQKMNEAKSGEAKAAAPVVKVSNLHKNVQDLIGYIYSEATTALTTTVNVKVTANGLETPLGVLTIGQIEKGEKILLELYELFQKKSKSQAKMVDLSNDFYTAIPHKIGRTRAQVADAVIDSMYDFHGKQETLQLMKDMLKVNGEGGNVLFNSKTDEQYEALGCEVGFCEKGTPEYDEMSEHVIKSQVKTKNIKVLNVYKLKRRDGEWDNFTSHIDNQRMLFHGSRIKNWVGILSRGILLPKIVVSMGVNRTDAGWLGNGIYFGDASCTSAFYTSEGKKGTRFMAVARVALGKMKPYHKITYGITEPPAGFHSCHGVRADKGVKSDFADDEYVIYDGKQQRLEYLVEFKM